MARKERTRYDEPEEKPAHRSVEEIKRDMGNTPAQGLAALLAELAAAEHELKSQPGEEGEEG